MSVPESPLERLHAHAAALTGPPPRRRATLVYFIQSCIGGPIKIGLTYDVEARLAQLQRSSPFRLVVLAAISENRFGEREFHQRFAPWRLHGEWFDDAAPGLADLIAMYRRPAAA